MKLRIKSIRITAMEKKSIRKNIYPERSGSALLTTRRRVFVGMSGGVDSSVTAALLKEQGFNVTGVHIKMWSDPEIPCNFKKDREDAIRVAAHLEIPFETWDFTKEYREEVVEYLIREYAAGRTPNPDVMCNRHIKFGAFLARALERGADAVATGHYVRREPEFSSINSQFSDNTGRIENFEIENSLKIENCKLKIAKDLNKDQSYFLWTLTQEQLKHCVFPIGEYTKPEVRALARKFGLPTAEKEESQGICFIGEIDLNQFLKKYIPVSRGRVRTVSGKDIGEHEGLQFYTIGQREGLGIGGGIPYYVASKDFLTNTLVVAEGPYDEGLFKSEIAVSDIHWISGRAPELTFQCKARIRYRQSLQSCWIEKSEIRNPKSEIINVRFTTPQRAVTPGQSIVFYAGEEMIGGGIIS